MAGLSRTADAAGDFGTPEQEVPATGLPGVDWESCMTMNDSWGFHASDTNWKSTETLIHTLVDIASKGGNFLLNVGPTAEGEIPEASVDRLRAMGRWLEVNAESIYGCGASPFRRLGWGRATTRPGKIYLHVFDWPEDGVLRIPGLLNEVRAASFLDPPQVLEHRIVHDEQGVAIVNLPDEATDPIDTVIVLDIAGEPAVIPTVPTHAADGTLTLHAVDASVRGSARYEPREDRRCIGFWMDVNDEIRWAARVRDPGPYEVTLELACEPGSEGSTFMADIDGSAVEGVVPATGGWGEFITVRLGPVWLDAGALDVTVKATDKPGLAVMNLRAVRLRPAG
jgi:alpha-L-fucosidase